MLKKIFLLCICINVSAFAANTDKTSVTIGLSEYPPYINYDHSGLLPELITSALQNSKFKIDYKIFPIKRAAKLVINNDIDAYAPGHIFTLKENNSLVRQVDILNVITSWAYYRPNNKEGLFDLLDGNDFSKFQNFKVGVIENSPYMELYKSAKLNVFELATPAQLLRMSRMNRIDVFETTLLNAYVGIQKYYPAELSMFNIIKRKPLTISLLINKNNKQLLSEFSKGLQLIMKNGEYMMIMERYWGVNNVPARVLPENMKGKGVESFSLFKFPSREKFRIDIQ